MNIKKYTDKEVSKIIEEFSSHEKGAIKFVEHGLPWIRITDKYIINESFHIGFKIEGFIKYSDKSIRSRAFKKIGLNQWEEIENEENKK